MMAVAPRILIWVGLISQLCIAHAAAQELTLTKDSEESFRRFMHMAQQGALGVDVRNANISLDGAQARIGLVRDGAPPTILLLGPKRSESSTSRYFDVMAGDHATAADVAIVGRALDQCFYEDPFQFAGLEESLASGPAPPLGEAWAYGGWRGVARVVERRLMGMASLEYTVLMTIVLALGFAASVVVLWSPPPAPRG